MLKEITLKNFKLHKDTKLNFGKITLFIGPNNSGKSSAFHAMQVLKKQIVRHADKFIDVDINYFNDLIRHKEHSFELKISGTVPIKNILSPSEIEIAKSFIADDKINVFSAYTLKNGNFLPKYKIEFLTYGFEILEYEKDKKIKNRIYTKDCGSKKSKIIIEEDNSIEIFNKDGEVLWLGSLSESFNGLDSTSHRGNDNVQEILKTILSSPGQLIKSFHFVYPIRGFEWQAYDIVESKESSKLNLDNISIEQRAKSIVNEFHYNRYFEDEIYEKMKDVVDVKFFADPLTKDKVRLISKKVGIPFLFEGLGSHQMLFILLPIALAESNETIFIEEPENHLHPKAQYELTKLFTEISEKQEKQLVMTTHSEHIVFGFLNQVAKKKLKKDELRIYYFENNDGVAEVKELKVNEFGQVDGGLPGFFEAKFERLLEFLNEPEGEDK